MSIYDIYIVIDLVGLHGKIQPMEKRSFAKFWMIITTAFLLVGLIVVAWFLSLEATEKESLEKYNQQQLLLVEGAAVGIEGLFGDLIASLYALGELPEIQYFDPDASRQELARKLEELAPLGITEIGLLDARGIAQFYAVDTQAEGIDYSWRSYFRAAQESQANDNTAQPIIEMQTIRPGELGFKIAIPLFETASTSEHPSPNGGFAGVIVGSLTLDRLVQRHIAPFKPPGNGNIFLANNEYDIIWSSDGDLARVNILGSGDSVFTQMADQMEKWGQGSARGDHYQHKKSTGWNDFELIAFAPVEIGGELMVVGVMTPDEVARQTSLANFQGQQRIFILSVMIIFLGVLVGGLILGRETRRRFQAEKALKKSEMEQAITKERNRLAGDLHDSVTQGLYGIVLHADAAKGQLTAKNSDRALDYLEEIKIAGKEALAEMRLLIFELRPPVLEREGLAAALETRLYAVEQRAGLKAEFQADIDDHLPLEVEDGLYRIAQEALNNTLKHAQAQQVWVRISQTGQTVTLEIADDGDGFELDSTHKHGGMGLSNMRARATQLGGELNIQSHPGEGTQITVEVKV